MRETAAEKKNRITEKEDLDSLFPDDSDSFEDLETLRDALSREIEDFPFPDEENDPDEEIPGPEGNEKDAFPEDDPEGTAEEDDGGETYARPRRKGHVIGLILLSILTGINLFALFENGRRLEALKTAEPSTIYVQVTETGTSAKTDPTKKETEKSTSGAESTVDPTPLTAPAETSAVIPGSISPLEEDDRYRITYNFQKLGVIVGINNFLNIREKPDIESNIIGKGTLYAAFDIIGEEGDWYQIRSGGLTGYVSKDYVATGEEAAVLAMEHCGTEACATEDGAKLYKRPNSLTKVLAELKTTGSYTVLKTIGGWVKLRVLDSIEGYVRADQLSYRYGLTEPFFFSADGSAIPQARLDVINYAFEWYGGDYVWGGSTLGQGVDCSGFVMRVFEHFGYKLPRLSTEQAQSGIRISSMSEAKPGDLLFFHGYRGGTVTSGIGHVAIYVGNGKMIHAASEARGIVCDAYNYVEEPIAIRRIIPD